MTIPQLDSIAYLVDQGDYPAATQALEALDFEDVHDVSLHLRLADLAQAAGAGGRLLSALTFAHRDDPQSPVVLRRLGQAYEDAGMSDNAVRVWRLLTERAPNDVAAWDALGTLLAETGRADESRAVFERALQATGDRRFRSLGREVRREGPIDDPAMPSEATLVRFVSLFEGREGVYARQWVSDQGATGYTPIREPFTVNVARNHMLGNITVGIYPIRLDNTVNFGAIDFDLPKSFIEQSSPGRPEWNKALGQMMEYAERLQRLAYDRGLTVHLEDSGWKGLHCWVLAAAPLPAVSMRKLLDTLLGLAGTVPPGITTEVFPKQNALPLDKLGNLIKLPMGVHRRTGRRATWVDENGVLVEDQAEYLMRARRVEAELVYRFLEISTSLPSLEVSAPAAGTELAVAADDDAPPFDPTGRAVARIEEYHPEHDLQYVTLTTHCAVLRELARKAEAERHLSNDEAAVLMYTLGHVDNGPRAVNLLLAKCPAADEALRLKSRLKGNPMSCTRVRSRVPHIAASVGCDCVFEQGAGLYPNPLLHLGAAEAASPHRLQALRLDSVIQDFLRARRGLHDAHTFYHDSCARLARYFDEAGIEEIATPYGRLQRFEEDGHSLFRLDV